MLASSEIHSRIAYHSIAVRRLSRRAERNISMRNPYANERDVQEYTNANLCAASTYTSAHDRQFCALHPIRTHTHTHTPTWTRTHSAAVCQRNVHVLAISLFPSKQIDDKKSIRHEVSVSRAVHVHASTLHSPIVHGWQCAWCVCVCFAKNRRRSQPALPHTVGL